MELTYENVTKWFDDYFKAFDLFAGNLETVPEMQKFFTPDLEFWPFNMPGERPNTRADLLRIMVHPGLHEEFTPQGYIVDLENMIVVVKLKLQFNDETTGQVWPAKMASAHYKIILDQKNNIKIKKIEYFTEAALPGDSAGMMDLWKQYREKALNGLVDRWISETAEKLG